MFISRSFSTRVPIIFDKALKRLQKNTAAGDVGNSRAVDYIRDEVADRMADRLLDIKRSFPKVLDIGSGPGYLCKYVDTDMIGNLTMLDSAEKALNRDLNFKYDVLVERVVADEESLPFSADSYDAVISCLGLHWINDLPGVFSQVCRILKSDGLFMGAIYGSESLFELRSSFILADLERKGGINARVSPMTQPPDVAHLLSRAGFNLTTIDVDDITVNYPGPLELMKDLQFMGENSALYTRSKNITRDTLIATQAIYKELYGNDDGSIPATFQIIYFIGWKPHPSQPKPLKRGSAQKSLKDL